MDILVFLSELLKVNFSSKIESLNFRLGNDILLFIAAAKCDDVNENYEISADVKDFAKRINSPIFKVSSKRCTGLDDLFRSIAFYSMKKGMKKSNTIRLNPMHHSKSFENLKRRRKKCC